MLTVKTKTQFARSSLCSKVETVWKVAYCFTYTRANHAKTARSKRLWARCAAACSATPVTAAPERARAPATAPLGRVAAALSQGPRRNVACARNGPASHTRPTPRN